jgi:hypothetical protein
MRPAAAGVLRAPHVRSSRSPSTIDNQEGTQYKRSNERSVEPA